MTRSPWLVVALLTSVVVIIALLVVIAVLLQQRRPQGPGPTVTASLHQIRVADRDRHYILYVPPKPADAPVPLLLMLHPGFGSADGFDRLTAISAPALDKGFILAYPQGYLRSWNAGECCGAAMRERLDDVGFLRAVIADAAAAAGVTAVEVYPVGFSNGAAMAYRLGCEAADEIAGIVAVGSAMRMGADSCRPARPVPVLHIHGEQDRWAPLRGGIGAWGQSGVQPPLSDTIDFWAGHNEASGPAEVNRDAGVTTSRRVGRGASPVVQVVVLGLGHQWPGGPGFQTEVFGPATAEPSATRLALEFIDECRRRAR